MTKAAYPLKLPNSIKQAAQRLAKEDGVSLNQWISSAVAQKVGSVETAAEFFKRRATRAKGTGLMRFLVNAPDVSEERVARRRPPSRSRVERAMALLKRKGTLPPAPGDEIPETYKAWEREQNRKPRRKARQPFV
jgi:hypothetical protein